MSVEEIYERHWRDSAMHFWHPTLERWGPHWKQLHQDRFDLLTEIDRLTTELIMYRPNRPKLEL